MSKVQTRRTVSLNRDVYERYKREAATVGWPLSRYVSAALADYVWTKPIPSTIQSIDHIYRHYYGEAAVPTPAPRQEQLREAIRKLKQEWRL